MKNDGTKKIDFSRKRIASLADKYYNEGDYFSALRFAYRELNEYGGDGDVFIRLADIYEGMGLHTSAINWLFRFLDIADPEDLPDIYEGLAVNFLHLGNETQSAYYYNQLIDADEDLSEETKFDIAEAFAKDKRDAFRFVYPPEIADFKKEIQTGAKALKNGDFEKAVSVLSEVEKGSKDYPSAMEMMAVAHLLSGDMEKAEAICKEVLQDRPDDIRLQATLAAAYLEQGKKEESREIALRLAKLDDIAPDDLYKVATVCCENDLHAEAYEKFDQLLRKAPYDGRTLYFKAVAAYNSGKLEEAERSLYELCNIYPDAEVAKYYLNELQVYQNGERELAPEMTYFYRLPQEEKELRCRAILQVSECSKDEAPLFGLLLLRDGYLRWCFDEMDGMEQELQYVAIMAAESVQADDFLREVFLDSEISDVLKVEALRALFERNKQDEFGIVLCNVYRNVALRPIRIGRKRRRKCIEAYAKAASKFAILRDDCGRKLQMAAEKLYRRLEQYDCLDLIDDTDDLSCAIFLLSGIKEMGENMPFIVQAFGANEARVQVLMSAYLSAEHGVEKGNGREDKEEKV
ncbi:MAG: tetratricopeptide repeat protein [Clostridia bacterium]|nr:tetratricopeptide repeat protein [Clostridia bacterium]